MSSGKTGPHDDVACFVQGTRIATPTGEKPVETLKAGDPVLTRDSGVRPVRWIGRRRIGWEEIRRRNHIKPVLIQQGALGPGMPAEDLRISPNHRILVDTDPALGGSAEALCAARHLVNGEDILAIEPMGVTYYHLLFDRHELILSNGAWSESFQPTNYVLQIVGNEQRAEILELFPELGTPAGIARFTESRPDLA